MPTPAKGAHVGAVPAVLRDHAEMVVLASLTTVVEVQPKAVSKFWELTTCALTNRQQRLQKVTSRIFFM